jgi:hypothetical protein
MNSHAVKQPAAIVGSPPGDPGAPSSRRLRAAPRESSAGLGASALAGTPAARILEELDVVVRKSHRRSALGHAPQSEQRLCQAVVEDGAGTAAAAIRPVAGNLVPLVPVGRLAEDAAGLPGEPGRLPAFPTAGSGDIASNRAAQTFHTVEG